MTADTLLTRRIHVDLARVATCACTQR
ncbi:MULTISPECIES: putative leader peptide [unclassified Streptomyces]